jgi:AmmeMemoRadiSam system protein B
MTPLGEIPVDRKAVNRLLKFPQVREWDVPHGPEHCLEVQLPFLQEVLGDFSIVPLVVGEATPDEVAEPLECLWGGPETLFVISSDLSHYHDYATARRLDYETANAIEQLQADRIGPEQACGCRAVGGLLSLAKRHDLHVTTIDLRNSGDTSGPRDEVVGYGAFAVV